MLSLGELEVLLLDNRKSEEVLPDNLAEYLLFIDSLFIKLLLSIILSGFHDHH